MCVVKYANDIIDKKLRAIANFVRLRMIVVLCRTPLQSQCTKRFGCHCSQSP